MASAQVELPHNLHAILKEADSQIDTSSDNLIEQLHAGIFLNENKLKFWVDRFTRANAFYIFARGLKITDGDNESCWKWIYKQDPDIYASVEMAELIKDRDLDVRKDFPAEKLTPGKIYQVSFVLMMTSREHGFDKDHPVNLQLFIPNGQETIERQEDFSTLQKNKWSVVRIGEFEVPKKGMTGNLEISMFEHGSQEKSGMIVNKIKILPLQK